METFPKKIAFDEKYLSDRQLGMKIRRRQDIHLFTHFITSPLALNQWYSCGNGANSPNSWGSSKGFQFILFSCSRSASTTQVAGL